MLQRGEILRVRVSLETQALQLHFTTEQFVGKFVELARMPIANAKLPVGTVLPELESFNAVGDIRKIGCSLDWISDRGEKDVGVCFLDVFHGGFNIRKFLSLVT